MQTQEKELKNQSNEDIAQFAAIERLFADGEMSLIEKNEAFPKYINSQSMAKFLSKRELFKQIIHIHGSIAK